MAASDTRYARLVRRENKLANQRAFARIAEEDAQRLAAGRIDSYEKKLRRKLEDKSFELADPEKIRSTVFAERSAAFRRDMDAKYALAAQDAKAQAEKAPEKKAELEAALEKTRAENQRLTAEFEAKLSADLAAALPDERDAALAEKAEAELLASVAQFREREEQKAQTKISAIRSASEKKCARLQESCDKLSAGLSAGKFAGMLPEGTVLRVKDLCMYFGGVHAVDGLSFDVKKGEIFGLIGPNGAGKTTVFNSITQFYKPTSGELYFENKAGRTVRLTDEKVHDVILQGIVRTFQNVEVIRDVTVLDNLLIAGHRRFTVSLAAQALHLPSLKREERAIREDALKVLEFMGLTEYKDWYAFGLPYGVLKKIEIARTLMCSPQLIILDEPAAGLNDSETAELSALIRRIRDEYDCTILLVEHDMGLVMDICETICAISFGKLLAIGTPAEIQADPEVRRAYLGEDDGEAERSGSDGTA